MKAIFIAYNQAFHEEILELMNQSAVRGFTNWEVVRGRGTLYGDPHLGDHAWPTLNSSMIIFAKDDNIIDLKKRLKSLDATNPAMGLHSFTWTVDDDN